MRKRMAPHLPTLPWRRKEGESSELRPTLAPEHELVLSPGSPQKTPQSQTEPQTPNSSEPINPRLSQRRLGVTEEDEWATSEAALAAAAGAPRNSYISSMVNSRFSYVPKGAAMSTSSKNVELVGNTAAEKERPKRLTTQESNMLDIMYKQTRRPVPLSPAAADDAEEDEEKDEEKADDLARDGRETEPEDAGGSFPGSLRDEVTALRREVAALRKSHDRMAREMQELKAMVQPRQQTQTPSSVDPKEKESTRASAGSEWLEAISTRLGLEAAISLRRSERRPTLAQE